MKWPQSPDEAVDSIAGGNAGQNVDEPRNQIGVVEHPAAEMRRAGAVERTASDLRAAGDQEVAAACRIEGYEKKGGMPIAAPRGIRATTVADGLRMTAEKRKSTTPKRSGVDSAIT